MPIHPDSMPDSVQQDHHNIPLHKVPPPSSDLPGAPIRMPSSQRRSVGKQVSAPAFEPRRRSAAPSVAATSARIILRRAAAVPHRASIRVELRLPDPTPPLWWWTLPLLLLRRWTLPLLLDAAAVAVITTSNGRSGLRTLPLPPSIAPVPAVWDDVDADVVLVNGDFWSVAEQYWPADEYDVDMGPGERDGPPKTVFRCCCIC